MPIFPFGDPVLLRGNDTGVLVDNSFRREKLTKDRIEVVPSVVRLKDLNGGGELSLDHVVKFDKQGGGL